MEKTKEMKNKNIKGIQVENKEKGLIQNLAANEYFICKNTGLKIINISNSRIKLKFVSPEEIVD